MVSIQFDFCKFWTYMLASLCYQFDNKTLEPITPTLGLGEKLHVPVYQDESIFQSNELRQQVWAKDGKVPLRKKGQERPIHMLDFIVELTGRLTLPEAEIEKQKHLPESEHIVEDAQEIIYPGKNAEGWWNAA